MKSIFLLVIYGFSWCVVLAQPIKRPRDYGIRFGVMPAGPLNAITDVPGVRVGQVTLQQGQSIRTGVTIILPHEGNLFQQKVPAAIYIGNGFGKLTGYSQVEELGTLETPHCIDQYAKCAHGPRPLMPLLTIRWRNPATSGFSH